MKADKPGSKDRVSHVLESITAIETFIQGHTKESFYMDQKTLSACLYQFTSIGEATHHIEKPVLKKYAYQWQKIKAFRNYILHEYFGIEMRLIWDTCIFILPELKKLMQQILDENY